VFQDGCPIYVHHDVLHGLFGDMLIRIHVCLDNIAAVSVAAQKNGGDSDHPIWRASGITSCTGSPGFPPGRTYAKFHASSALTAIYCDAIANALVRPNRLQCIWLRDFILK
jgi:hypothetical protein